MKSADRVGPRWADALTREASERFRSLVTDHGFAQEDRLDGWSARVVYRGDRFMLSLQHGGREFEFLAEIKYARLPRKDPVALWLVLEALGISEGPVAMGAMVDEARLRTLVGETAELIAENWGVIDRDPTPELFREIKRIADRLARRVRRDG
jgi:hypothetical protein